MQRTNTNKVLIKWSPNSNRIVVGVNTLRMFQLDVLENDALSLNLVGIDANFQNIRCFDWSPTDDTTLAVGLQNGRVVLTQFAPEAIGRNAFVQECVPQYTRTCNDVAWNHGLPNLLAVGFDKSSRSDGVYVWDLETAPSLAPNASYLNDSLSAKEVRMASLHYDNSNDFINTITEKRFGFGAAEGSVALSWLPTSAHCLVSGTQSTWLRIYDLRDSSIMLSTKAHPSKSVQGVTFSPSQPHHCATFSEKQIKLWDIRKFNDCFLSLNNGSKTVAQVSWSPTARKLASISRDEAAVKIWDLTVCGFDDDASEQDGRHYGMEGPSYGQDMRHDRDLDKTDEREKVLDDSSSDEESDSPPDEDQQNLEVVEDSHLPAVREAVIAKEYLTSEKIVAFSWLGPNLTPIESASDASHQPPAPHNHQDSLLTVGAHFTVNILTLKEPLTVAYAPTGDVGYFIGRNLYDGEPPFSVGNMLEFISTAPSALPALASALENEDEADLDHQGDGTLSRTMGSQESLAVSMSLVHQGERAREQERAIELWRGIVKQFDTQHAAGSLSPHHHASPGNSAPHSNSSSSSQLAVNNVNTSNNTNSQLQAHSSQLASQSANQASPQTSSLNLLDGKESHQSSSSSSGSGGSLVTDPYQEAALKGLLDISYVMKERARIGYSGNIKKNHQEIVPLFADGSLACVWEWLFTMKFDLNKGGAVSEYKGIYSFISGPNAGQDKDNKTPLYPKWWASNGRAVCQKLCGFPITQPDFKEKIESLEQAGHHARAAALSVWHFKIPTAIQSLTNAGPTSHLHPRTAKMCAIALSGYDPTNSLWQTTCRSLVLEIDDPYLKAMFLFLCQPIDGEEETGNSFSDVLSDNLNISILDKIAFACRFLDSNLLLAYLKKQTEYAMTRGLLEGLLLCGIDETGAAVTLLQSYLDRTGDIQSVALLCAQISKRKITNSKLEQWIEVYSQLLDRWQCWFERAQFDIDRVPHVRAQPQVYATCKYCNGSFTIKEASKKGQFADGPLQLKVSSCPNCKKPLPLCAICLLPVECIPFDSRVIKKPIGETAFWSSLENNFDDWFSWCQTCKHGGHSKHMAEWFKEHLECPVADCQCNCCSL